MNVAAHSFRTFSTSPLYRVTFNLTFAYFFILLIFHINHANVLKLRLHARFKLLTE